MNGARRRLGDVVPPFLLFATFVGFWNLAHYVLMSKQRRFLVPPPHRVVNEAFLTWKLGSSEGSLRGLAGGGLHDQLVGLWLSTRVALLGLSIAIVVGISLAVLMSRRGWLERAIFPYLVALQATPILAFVPLIGVLWGFVFRSRVLVCVLIAIFPIVANTLFGIKSVEATHHDLFDLHKANSRTRLWKLQLPAALPNIFTGLRISAGLSVIGAVVGDTFFRQGKPGIGQLIDRFRASNSYEQMYGSVILTALLGITVFWFFGWLANRIVGHWHESSGQTR